MSDQNVKNSNAKSREHLANERTFLAWIRTSIAMMGLGFVIVKFSLFLKQISLILQASATTSKGYSSMIGVVMVGLGIIIALLAFLQYKKNEKQINDSAYITSTSLSFFTTLIILTSGVLLIVYLLSSI